jgi:hypothetical protein
LCLFVASQAVSDFDVFNLDDVDTAFALVQSLRYQQNLSLRCGTAVLDCRRGRRREPFAGGTCEAMRRLPDPP